MCATPRARPGSTSSSRPRRSRRDGRHGHPAGDRRRGAAVADLAARRVRGIPAAGRDLRRGARSRQPRHDHPGGGCGGRGCRRPDRPHGRPLQPQGRARVDGLALPPAGRGRRRPRRRPSSARTRPASASSPPTSGEATSSTRARCSPSPPRGCSATRRAASTRRRCALADLSLRLPIYGRAESLNLATAASVCLYETAFAQRAAG